MDLVKNKIEGTDHVYYIPEFLTEDEEHYLIRKIQEAPRQSWRELANRRLQLWGGQLAAKNVLMIQPMPSFVTTFPGIIPRLEATGMFRSSAHQAPNHIIMNEYLPGQGIMPHQDGPAYHPVVATISLGSHTAFHYYRYKAQDANSIDVEDGRIIDSTPVLSVLLEPRSVIITTGNFYTSYLHGIQELTEDTIVANDGINQPKFEGLDTTIANWKMLAGSETRSAVMTGGTLKRGVRYSLTCRDVENVANIKSFLNRG